MPAALALIHDALLRNQQGTSLSALFFFTPSRFVSPVSLSSSSSSSSSSLSLCSLSLSLSLDYFSFQPPGQARAPMTVLSHTDVDDIEDLVAQKLENTGLDRQVTHENVKIGTKLKRKTTRQKKKQQREASTSSSSSAAACDCDGLDGLDGCCSTSTSGRGRQPQHFQGSSDSAGLGKAEDRGIDGSGAPGVIPGTASVWVKTFGCSHNQSDSEYMAGQLEAYGYRIVSNSNDADLWLVNTCTVKNPSETAMVNIVNKGRELEKPMVVAGCVPQGEKNIKGLEKASLLGVAQIDRVVEAVEETLQGNTVRLLEKKELPRLDLPKVRRNKHIEIIPLSTGCLGNCTYCKTKHARGELGSYDPEAIVFRAKSAVLEGQVREIWLSSEDTGAYGRDIGVNLPFLVRKIIAVLPPDGRTRLRIGMTNPPFMVSSVSGSGI